MAAQCRARVVTYGLENDAHFRAELVADSWPNRLAVRIRYGNETALAETRLLGRHQASNAVAAIATACSLGVPLADAAMAVSRHAPLLGRMSVHETSRGVTFIRDDWKAPNWSLPSALEYMARAQASRKLIVIGTISDYGGTARRVYRRAVAGAMQAADHVVIVGPRAHSTATRFAATGADKLTAFETVREAAKWLGDFARAGDLVLLKGSNPADHLARLALLMDREVACWRRRCGRDIFCDHCRLLEEPSPP
jgi:UDP-N-acetylmuramoyl-tripeptide--D-alanyl-D-alanine ligase